MTLPLLFDFGGTVTLWPREGVVLLILIAIALVAGAVYANLRGTAVTAQNEPLDAPSLPPPSHEPVAGEQGRQPDVTSMNREPYDPDTGNPEASDLTYGEREPFDI